MQRIIAVGLIGVLVSLLTSCGDGGEAKLQALQDHPLADPIVTAEPVRQSSISGDTATGLFDSNPIYEATTTYGFETDNERDEILEQIFAHTHQLGYETRLISDERGLPIGTYRASAIPEYPNIFVSIHINFDTINVEIRS